MRLIVAPRPLVTLLRFAEVALLLLFAAVIGAGILGQRWQLPGGPTLGGSHLITFVGVAALTMLSVASPPAEAQTPHPDLLRELGTRLLQPPDCAPRCAEIASAKVDISAHSVTIELRVHALEAVAVPLPGSLQGWRPEAVRVDGSSPARVLRGKNQHLWLHVNEGRHDVLLVGSVPAVDSLEIPFPTPPRFVEASSDYWFIAGIKDHQLRSGSLQLTRLQTEQDGSGESVRWESSRFPAFVRLERKVDLDLDWLVTTNVVRIAPNRGALTLEVPLLEGESVVSDNFTVQDGRILVTMTPDQNAASWHSNLSRTSPLVMTAEAGSAWEEQWRVSVGNVWHAEFSGVPESETGASAEGLRVAEFHPRGGESLTISATRPQASVGSTLAFDSVTLDTRLGNRSRDVVLALAYRSTRGSQHVIQLPATAEVTQVTIDGDIQPLRSEKGQLTIPIVPGEHDINIGWRESGDINLLSRTPMVNIGAPSSNIRLGLELPANRWLLATTGPRLGPAILYWSELVVLVLFAVILGRVGLAPLTTRHWLLLGLGFSTFSWLALALVALWLLACGARERWQPFYWWQFDLVQIGLTGLTVVALLAIVISLPMGLLGTPDMHVAGNNSFGNTLTWFADRSESALPAAKAVSVPIWIYKSLILAWALWLSFALLRWLPWVWRCFSNQGYWRPRKRADDASGTGQ